MKINTEIIKRHRADKLWSQEQFAEACGLGLRTVQRIEKSGRASIESVRAIAAVLEIESETLVDDSKPFSGYEHTQIGYASMVLFFTILSLIFTAVYSKLDSLEGSELITLSIVCALFFLIGVLFSTLKIKVEKELLTWHFSLHFWKKTIKIEEIASCRIVENSILAGIGIRLLPNGWLYNVSGIMAVEIVLKSGDKIRLGTDEPEYLNQAIRDAL